VAEEHAHATSPAQRPGRARREGVEHGPTTLESRYRRTALWGL
jgi:hypothetical protein